MTATVARPTPQAAQKKTPSQTPGQRQHRRAIVWTVALAGALVVSAIVTIGLGPVPIPPDVVARILAHHLFGIGEVTWTASDDNIVWLLRIPRVLLGICVGAILSIAGVAVQSLVRNPLADPYLLGISSGASAGAAASILFGVGAGALALTGSAFLGAVAAIVLVFAACRMGGQLIPARLVFAGIAVGFALTAVTNFLVFTSDSRDGARAVMFWMLGSLSQARWQSVPIAAAALLIALATLLWWARRLDAIAIGDDAARSLGTNPSTFRAGCALLVCFAVAAAVSVSGAIGFVGLVVPHLARRLVGATHRLCLPAAALLGGLLLIWADALARTAFEPRELPLGILTALIGTPLLIVLVRRLTSH
ncbi:FecCD family ABC transporter permease [Natronoglycomyces albus]|uniref:Iron ABC transporter permease n=1 Tax=Natronoglycomyces albus TaxID=2811108 RepID=A0A895XKT4_9ACTN|nr:iron ABC transporter permease [Natronoglycomyces albus]QSB04173.1 iron ABC transporter permease [Natronoglycomyces albus]